MSGEQDAGSSCATCQGQSTPVPIVFVPGIMGTRMDLSGSTWDPDDTVGMVPWLTRRSRTKHDLLRHNSPGSILTTKGAASHGLRRHPRSGAILDRDTYQRRINRGWAGVSGTYYGPIMGRMDATVYKPGYINPVFGCGYDWRQSNADSGDHIANKVSQVLAATGASKAIIVTHSMGGIATRAGLKRNPGVASKVAGVVHMAQPALGAPTFYRKMVAGNTWGQDGVMRFVMGGDPDSVQVGVGGIRGAFQLLPVEQYRDPTPSHGDWWLHYRTFERPNVDMAWRPAGGDVWDMYQRPDSPPGIVSNTHGSPNIITPQEWGERGPAFRAMVEDSLRVAKTFHRWLQLYKHTNTWTIYSTGLASEMRVDFRLAPLQVDVQPYYGGMMGGVIYSARRADGTTAVLRPGTDAIDPGTYTVVLEAPNIRPEGDGTVPAPSARGLFPGESHPYRANDDYGGKHQFFVTGATHDGMCNDAGSVNLLAGIIPHIIENHV